MGQVAVDDRATGGGDRPAPFIDLVRVVGKAFFDHVSTQLLFLL